MAKKKKTAKKIAKEREVLTVPKDQSGTIAKAPTGHFCSGNSKLGEEILSYDISPIITCPGSGNALCRQLRPDGNADPKEICWARRKKYREQGKKDRLDANFRFTQGPDFVPWANKTLSRRRKVLAVRIPGTGDFYSVEFVNKVMAIVRANPKMHFYGYTKSWAIPRIWEELQRLGAEPNMVLWLSWDRLLAKHHGAPPDRKFPWCWLAETDNDVPPVPVALVWRYDGHLQWNKKLPYLTALGGSAVCPHEDGRTKTTCAKCGICWRGTDFRTAKTAKLLEESSHPGIRKDQRGCRLNEHGQELTRTTHDFLKGQSMINTDVAHEALVDGRRLGKATAAAMLKVGVELKQFKQTLGSGFYDFARTRLGLTPAIADFFIRLSETAGLDVAQFSPAIEMKLPRLLDVFGVVVATYTAATAGAPIVLREPTTNSVSAQDLEMSENAPVTNDGTHAGTNAAGTGNTTAITSGTTSTGSNDVAPADAPVMVVSDTVGAVVEVDDSALGDAAVPVDGAGQVAVAAEQAVVPSPADRAAQHRFIAERSVRLLMQVNRGELSAEEAMQRAQSLPITKGKKVIAGSR
jgi:hypothetical protein